MSTHCPNRLRGAAAKAGAGRARPARSPAKHRGPIGKTHARPPLPPDSPSHRPKLSVRVHFPAVAAPAVAGRGDGGLREKRREGASASTPPPHRVEYRSLATATQPAPPTPHLHDWLLCEEQTTAGGGGWAGGGPSRGGKAESLETKSGVRYFFFLVLWLARTAFPLTPTSMNSARTPRSHNKQRKKNE